MAGEMQVPLLSQLIAPEHVSGSCAFATGVQVPVAQLWHTCAQAELQQWLSAQNPLAHSLAAPHICPSFLVQVPEALQVMAPLQLSGSSAFVRRTQVPPPPVHA
jgi:hypothetical protein